MTIINNIVDYVMHLSFGGLLWFLMRYVVRHIINIILVTYPQWSTFQAISFLSAFMDWGYLLIVALPATLNLWVNSQKPEAGQ